MGLLNNLKVVSITFDLLMASSADLFILKNTITIMTSSIEYGVIRKAV